VAELLETSGSTYFAAFRTSFRDLIAAIVEAQDLALYSLPLATLLEQLNRSQDLPSLASLVEQTFHSLALTWSHSLYYTNGARFSTFLQQWINLFIVKVSLSSTNRSSFSSSFAYEVDSSFSTAKRFTRPFAFVNRSNVSIDCVNRHCHRISMRERFAGLALSNKRSILLTSDTLLGISRREAFRAMQRFYQTFTIDRSE
jgi:hypothetical protein